MCDAPHKHTHTHNFYVRDAKRFAFLFVSHIPNTMPPPALHLPQITVLYICVAFADDLSVVFSFPDAAHRTHTHNVKAYIKALSI